MKNYEDMIGRTYCDPEGEWKITDVIGETDTVLITCIGKTKVESNIGLESAVSIEEARYFLEGNEKHLWG